MSVRAQTRDDQRALAQSSLSLQSAPASVSLACEGVDDLLASSSVWCDDEGTRFRLHVVVRELVSNAILHAPEDEPIGVDLTLYEDRAEITVRSGGDFSMSDLRRGGPTGGRGLEIIATIVDQWMISSGAAGTAVTVTVSTATVPPAG